MNYKVIADSSKKSFLIRKKKNLLLTAVATLCLTASSMAQNVPNYVPTNGLLGWWPFNGNANDESGNGNNGTVNGATLTQDRFGNNNKSYSFGGNSPRTIDIDANLPFGDFTISLWLNAIDTTMNAIMDWRNTSNNLPVLSFNFDVNYGSGFMALLRDNLNGATVNVNPNFLPNTNSWYFITLTKNANQLTFYINGINYISTNYTQSTWTLNRLTLGNNYYDPTFFYTGKLDDIGAWNRALSQQEISDLYNGDICYQSITVTDTLLINMGITGFNPVTYNNTIKIFPNPSNDHITINYGNFASFNGYKIKIENSLGQQVFQTNITQQSDYLNLTTWGGNGLYFVRIIDPQQNTIDIKKIVLQ